IAAKPEVRFPIEFLYELHSPRADATLCPCTSQALRSGVRSRECIKSEPGKYVCPLGFWGFNRVIEWHLYRPEAKSELSGMDVALQSRKLQLRKTLKPLGAALFGASRKADAGVRGSVGRLTNTLKTVAARFEMADNWKSWAKNVTTLSPSLLLLLPHSDKDRDNIITLEIGGENLAVDQIDENYVFGPNPP